MYLQKNQKSEKENNCHQIISNEQRFKTDSITSIYASQSLFNHCCTDKSMMKFKTKDISDQKIKTVSLRIVNILKIDNLNDAQKSNLTIQFSFVRAIEKLKNKHQ